MSLVDFGFTDRIPGSFTKINAEAYYSCAIEVLNLRARPTFVEVGVDQGRSASVIMQAIKTTGVDAFMILVDSWESVLIGNKAKVETLAQANGIRHVILHMTSVEAAMAVADQSIDMILIDANHTESHPNEDCEAWLPKLKSGGIACFHDYSSGFQAVDDAVDFWTSAYLDHQVYEGLAVRRKP
jgi:predicted O-methyltransferase YrrM